MTAVMFSGAVSQGEGEIAPAKLPDRTKAGCNACPHLRVAHTWPDGLCLLCGCPGWVRVAVAAGLRALVPRGGGGR